MWYCFSPCQVSRRFSIQRAELSRDRGMCLSKPCNVASGWVNSHRWTSIPLKKSAWKVLSVFFSSFAYGCMIHSRIKDYFKLIRFWWVTKNSKPNPIWLSPCEIWFCFISRWLTNVLNVFIFRFNVNNQYLHPEISEWWVDFTQSKVLYHSKNLHSVCSLFIVCDN